MAAPPQGQGVSLPFKIVGSENLRGRKRKVLGVPRWIAKSRRDGKSLAAKPRDSLGKEMCCFAGTVTHRAEDVTIHQNHGPSGASSLASIQVGRSADRRCEVAREVQARWQIIRGIAALFLTRRREDAKGILSADLKDFRRWKGGGEKAEPGRPIHHGELCALCARI